MTSTNTSKRVTEADRTIGSRIAALRVAQGMSQTALGNALGISFQQVQKYEKGVNRVGANRLQIIADLMGVSIQTFFVNQSGADAEVVDVRAFYNDPQVVKLVTAFTGIADTMIRKSLLSIVETTSTIHRDPAARR